MNTFFLSELVSPRRDEKSDQSAAGKFDVKGGERERSGAGRERNFHDPQIKYCGKRALGESFALGVEWEEELARIFEA